MINPGTAKRSDPPAARAILLTAFALGLAALALYARTAAFSVINIDDPDYVVFNPHLRSGLTLDSVQWAFTTSRCSNWHPLTWISLLLDAQLYQLSPAGLHLENAVWHALNSALLLVLMVRLTGARWASIWIAAIFALHPLRVESVAWISERKDLLCGFFMLAALIAYVQYARKPGWREYAATMVLFALALLAKPMAVTLPGVMLLLDHWPLGRPFKPRIILEKLPLLAMSAGCVVMTIVAQSSVVGVKSMVEASMAARLSNAMISYATYLRMTIAPFGLAIFYPHPSTLPGASIPIVATVVSTIIVLAITVIAVAHVRRRPWLFVGWFWYLGTLVPVIGVLQVGLQAMADRYTYFPMIGVTIAIAWWAREIQARNGLRAGQIMSGLGIATCVAAAIVTVRQIEYWRDSLTVMSRAIAVVPNNYFALASRGSALEANGDGEAAYHDFAESLRIRPDYGPALLAMAMQAESRGDVDTAFGLYERAVAVYQSSPAAFNNYGLLLDERGRHREAASVFHRALQIDPSSAAVYTNLAVSLCREAPSNVNEATELIRTAMSIDPDYADAHFWLGQVLVFTGHGADGVKEMRSAIALDPERADYPAGLAWILATRPEPQLRDPAAAIQLAENAYQLSQNQDPDCLDILAAAEARAGRFDRAGQIATQALALADQKKNETLAGAIRARLEQYRRQQAIESSDLRF